MANLAKQSDQLLDHIFVRGVELAALRHRVDSAVTQIRLFQLREYNLDMEAIEGILTDEEE